MPAKPSRIVGAAVAAILGVAAWPAAEAKTSQDDVTQQEIQTLRDQVNALQRRLDAQTAAQQRTQAAADEAAAQAAAAKSQAAATRLRFTTRWPRPSMRRTRSRTNCTTRA